MRRLCSVMGLCLSFALSCLAGENLLTDGASFEAGFDGFNLNNQYLLSHRGKEIESVFDDTTAVHGRYSLRIDNPLLDKIYLAYRPIRVETDQAVTVSGSLKGRGSASVQLMRWPWKTAAQLEVTLTDTWQRFDFPADIDNDQAHFLWIIPGMDCSRIYVDALQIQSGELSPFLPKPLTFSLGTTTRFNTCKVGDDVCLEARLYVEGAAKEATISVEVLDIFREKVLEKTVPVDVVDAHATLRIPLFKATHPDSYKVIAKATCDGHTEQEIVSIGILKPVVEADPFFGFQVKHIFNDDAERRTEWNNQQMELVYSNVDPSYINRLIRMVGAPSVRCFRTTEWRKLEQKNGDFVWRDDWVKLQKADGLSDPLIILNAHPPKWAEMIPVKDVKKYAFDKSPKAIPLMDHWKRYVRAMITHYKGLSRYYEVVNEPETIFPAPHIYVDYLKEAYQIIKEVAPDAQVVAPSYSGRGPIGWIEGFVEAGGHEYTDIWAIHYAGRTFPEQGMDETTYTWELIRKYRQILIDANGGKDKPMWNTEGGSFYWMEEFDHWPAPEQNEYNAEHHRVRNESLAAAYVPRLQLIEKCSGMDRLYSFEFGFYYSQNASKSRDYRSRYINWDGSPSPALVTFNVVADMFAGATPVAIFPRHIEATPDHYALILVFERQGKTVGAIWKGAPLGETSGFEKYDPPLIVDAKLPGNDLALTDMLGRPSKIQAQGSGVRLVTTAFPQYFTSSLAPATVVGAFHDATVSLGARPSITVSFEELFEGQYYSAALALMEQKLETDPGDTASLIRKARALVELQQVIAARDCLETVLATDPDSFEGNCMLGKALHGMLSARNYKELGVEGERSIWAAGLAKVREPYARAWTNRPEAWRQDAKAGGMDHLVLCFDYWYSLGDSDPRTSLELTDIAEQLSPGNFRTKRMVDRRSHYEKLAAKGN